VRVRVENSTEEPEKKSEANGKIILTTDHGTRAKREVNNQRELRQFPRSGQEIQQLHGVVSAANLVSRLSS